MAYEAKVLADSVSPAGVRLTTVEFTTPRSLQAELNTHRDFSRNSASSRAIPLATMIKGVETDPFIPAYWGANQSGMQARQEISEDLHRQAIAEWLAARDSAVKHARRMGELGLHKQTANRVLEPFMWQRIIVTATNWSNFFALRDSPDAQPEIRLSAVAIREAMEASVPRRLAHGEWHMPLLRPEEVKLAQADPERWRKICVGRCARISYATHDGVRDPEKDVELYERLVAGGHMSPLEHVARPITWRDRIFHPKRSRSNFRGWVQYRKLIPNEHDFSLIAQSDKVAA